MVYKIEMKRPNGGNRILKKYYNNELLKLKLKKEINTVDGTFIVVAAILYETKKSQKITREQKNIIEKQKVILKIKDIQMLKAWKNI